MLTVTTVQSVRERVREWHAAGLRIAFVPTMGNLHAGHMSLLAAARYRGDRVLGSIFVNPLQFGPGEDFRPIRARCRRISSCSRRHAATSCSPRASRRCIRTDRASRR